MEERAEGLPAPRGLCRGAADAAQRESPLVENTSITHPSPPLGAGPAPAAAREAVAAQGAADPRLPPRPRSDICPFPEESCPFTCRPHGVKHTARAAEQFVAQVCLAETGEMLCGFCWQPATSRRSYSSSFLLTPLHLNSWRVYHMVFQLTPTKAVPRPQQIQKH